MKFFLNGTVIWHTVFKLKLLKSTWEEAKCGDKVLSDLETNEKSIKIDPYCCSIKEVGHIQRKICGHVYFFLNKENGQIDGTVTDHPLSLLEDWRSH